MQSEKKIIEKLFNNKILLGILLLALCGPYMLTRDMEETKHIYEFVTTIASWAVIFLYARYGKITIPAVWLFVFLGWSFVTTFFLSGNTLSFYQIFLPVAAMSLLIELAIIHKGYTLLDAVAVFRIYLYANFLLVILFRQGVSGPERWLLGYRNMQSWTILPVLTLLMIRALWKFGKIDKLTVLDVIIGMITLVIVKSATSWVGAFVYLVMLCISFFCYKKKKPMPKIINLFDGLAASILFFVGIVLLKLQHVFEPLIVNILHKDISFTGRTVVWDMAVDFIKTHWFAGAGYLKRAEYVNLFKNDGYNYPHPHNYVLSLLMQGGVVLLAIVIIGFVIAGIKLWKERCSLISNLLLTLLLSLVIMGFTEALSMYMCSLMYPMLILAMHVEKLKNVERRGNDHNMQDACRENNETIK